MIRASVEDVSGVEDLYFFPALEDSLNSEVTKSDAAASMWHMVAELRIVICDDMFSMIELDEIFKASSSLLFKLLRYRGFGRIVI